MSVDGGPGWSGPAGPPHRRSSVAESLEVLNHTSTALQLVA